MNLGSTENYPQKLLWNKDVLPNIVKAGRFYNKDQEFRTVYCSSSTHRLHLYEYDGKMLIRKQKLRLTKGTITISPAGEKTAYHLADKAGGWHYSICFSSKMPIKQSANSIFSVPLYQPPVGTYVAYESRVREITTMFMRGKHSALAAFAASISLLQLLLRLSLYSQDTDPEEDVASTLERKLLHTTEYIEVNLEHSISDEDLAEYCNLSPDYLSLMFKKKYGVPLQRYILTRRIDKARLLLETTSMSIKEIGAQVGFPDPQYFNKRFRLIVGRSPSEYRAHIENLVQL